MKGLVRRNCMLETRDLRSHMWPCSRRNQNRFRPHTCSCRETNSMRVLENGAGFHQSHLVALERRDVRGFQPCNLPIFVGNQAGPMKRSIRHRPAVASCIFKFVGKPRRVDKKLFWHTTADDACPTDPIFLGGHHACAVTGGDTRGPHTAGSSPNYEKIEVVIGHQSSPTLTGIAMGDRRR